MKLEDQVCTLEQAKKLRELGITQDSLFYWIDRAGQSRVVFEKNIEFLDQLPIISAYTVAELGEMLPYSYLVVSDKVLGERIFTIWKLDDRLKLDNISGLHKYYENEAEARADLLIHLIENGIVSPSNPAEK